MRYRSEASELNDQLFSLRAVVLSGSYVDCCRCPCRTSESLAMYVLSCYCMDK
jgi:hypothetical protein